MTSLAASAAGHDDGFTEAQRREREIHAAKVADFELKRKMKTTVVPTDDTKVRSMLRQLGEPITLFGEREMERRERLRKLMAQQDAELAEAPAIGQVIVEQLVTQQTELFYTEGPEELKQARAAIAQYSLRQACQRLTSAKRRRDDVDSRMMSVRAAAEEVGQVQQIAEQSSQIGDERPISGCQFSPNGQLLASCGWGGAVSVWAVAGCKREFTVRPHEERCTGVTWHPAATTSQSAEAVNMATASADCSAKLLTAAGKEIRKLEGHTDRLARLAFHPMGRHLATASWDMTWRLWDVETGQSLLEQEGHSRAVYSVGFHPDGSLAGSAGLDSIGRIWDCRTGRSIWVLEGHVKQILALDFSPNGYHVATGSDDHTCKVWDLRARKCLYTIPAHRSLVSSVRYSRSGACLATSGYDALVKMWSGKDFSLVKTLAGHEGKVMCVDIAPDGSHTVGSVSYDRTIKLWAPESIAPLQLGDGGGW